jgi:8-oxo-dGTP diphosphatase
MHENRAIDVVCGVVFDDRGSILIARKAPGKAMAGFWEFPGGKVDPGETEIEALKRELAEEFGMEVEVGERLGAEKYAYPQVTINLIAFRCMYRYGTFQRTDHDEFDWVKKEELHTFRFAPADVFILNLL